MFNRIFLFLKRNRKETFIVVVSFFIMFHAVFVTAPLSFPLGELVFVEEGFTVSETARLLEEKRIIRSSLFFTWLITTFVEDGEVRSGTYRFERPLSIFGVAQRLSLGTYGTPFIRVTIHEGATVRDIALIFKEALPEFDDAKFIALAKVHEGYLFPDTYLFAPGTTPETVIKTMRENFDEQIGDIRDALAAFGEPLEDIVVMASLVEREARQYETKRIVTGILWKRLELGMPLQVDAVFGYILGTDTFSPTFEQLKIDSPYNTYTHTGLPPGPIGNPGLNSLKAAVNPQESPFLYYLTGADGAMRYAKTFDEHVANRRFLK